MTRAGSEGMSLAADLEVISADWAEFVLGESEIRAGEGREARQDQCRDLFQSILISAGLRAGNVDVGLRRR